jgi:hypothetical protein
MVLDLDHTCVHSLPWEEFRGLPYAVKADLLAVYPDHFFMHHHSDGSVLFVCFVRPGLHVFLETVLRWRAVRHIYVWTMAVEWYAREVVREVFLSRGIPVDVVLSSRDCEISRMMFDGHPKDLRLIDLAEPRNEGESTPSPLVLFDDVTSMSRNQEGQVVTVDKFNVFDHHISGKKDTYWFDLLDKVTSIPRYSLI